MAKISIAMRDEILARVDSMAEKLGYNRSQFITIACNDYIKAQDKIPELLEMLGKAGKAFTDYSDGSIDVEEFARRLK